MNGKQCSFCSDLSVQILGYVRCAWFRLIEYLQNILAANESSDWTAQMHVGLICHSSHVSKGTFFSWHGPFLVYIYIVGLTCFIFYWTLFFYIKEYMDCAKWGRKNRSCNMQKKLPRSACAAGWFDQGLYCLPRNSINSLKWTVKTLINTYHSG